MALTKARSTHRKCVRFYALRHIFEMIELSPRDQIYFVT